MKVNGARMKEARERAGLTLHEAKTRIGVASHYLEALENNELEDPVEEVVQDAASLYKVRTRWLTSQPRKQRRAG